MVGTASFVGSFGAALGAFSAGLIFDITQSYNWAFIICVVLAVLGVAYATFVKRLELKQQWVFWPLFPELGKGR
jgi:MFS family permease